MDVHRGLPEYLHNKNKQKRQDEMFHLKMIDSIDLIDENPFRNKIVSGADFTKINSGAHNIPVCI